MILLLVINITKKLFTVLIKKWIQVKKYFIYKKRPLVSKISWTPSTLQFAPGHP